MKVLLIGGGGREHALGWKIAQSPRLSHLYTTSANPGLNHIAAPVAIGETDGDAIARKVDDLSIDLVVIGPEAPLAAGVGDALRAIDVPVFGPDRAAAILETSKAATKDVCAAVGAPTAAYGHFNSPSPAKEFLRSQKSPFVVKADGLAAGKGVVIADTLQQADAAVDRLLAGDGAEIVIEEFMQGEEASLFALCDGETVIPFGGAQDHKRAFDCDTGPNTGGMGAYAPAPICDASIQTLALNDIIRPVIAEMARRGTPFRGVLYAGLMIDAGRPRLVEFNVRFGDPECQVLMRRLNSDLLDHLTASATGTLATAPAPIWSPQAAACVVLASEGYPGAYDTGLPITGVDDANALDDVVVFHAGTKREDGVLKSNGGRVLNVTGLGDDIEAAVNVAYEGVRAINFPGGFYRKDIGWRALGGKPSGAMQ